MNGPEFGDVGSMSEADMGGRFMTARALISDRPSTLLTGIAVIVHPSFAIGSMAARFVG
jgi:hypothetical protein